MKVRKHLFFLPLIVAQLAWAENEKGNGGDVIVCKLNGTTTAEVLDLYEGRILAGATPDFGEEAEYPDMVEFAIKRLDPYDPHRAKFYRRIAKIFEEEKFKWTDKPLPDVPDSNHRVIPPENCDLEQIVVWWYPNQIIHFSDNPVFKMSKRLWKLLDEANRAILTLHEAAWVYESFYWATNSKSSRKINRILYSEAYWDNNIKSFSDYINYLTRVKAKVYQQGQVRCVVWPYPSYFEIAEKQEDLLNLKERWRPFEDIPRMEFCVGRIGEGHTVTQAYYQPKMKGITRLRIERNQIFNFHRENPKQVKGIRLYYDPKFNLDHSWGPGKDSNRIYIDDVPFIIVKYVGFHPNGNISRFILAPTQRSNWTRLRSPLFKANEKQVPWYAKSEFSEQVLVELWPNKSLKKVSSGKITLNYQNKVSVTLRSKTGAGKKNTRNDDCGPRFKRDHFECYLDYLSGYSSFQFDESDGSFSGEQNWLELVGDQELIINGKPYRTKPNVTSYVKFKGGLITDVREVPGPGYNQKQRR